MLIDTHAHLYHKQYDGDRREVVRHAVEAGVGRIYLPNIDAESVVPMDAMADAWPDLCRPMMGLHPSHVGEDPTRELADVERLLATGRYWAVGEIGIDLYWDRTWLKQQQDAFRTQVRWAKQLALPVVIHCRESFDEVIAIVEEENDATLSGVFHCFTGTPEQARRVIALGDFFLGIGGVITFAKSGLSQTMAEVGLDACVLETDSPYLAPAPHRGRRNETAHLPLVAAALAAATGRTVEDVARVTTANAQALFGP